MQQRWAISILFPALVAFLPDWAASNTGSGQSPAEPGPKIVVLISLDQFRWDYYERFEPFFVRDGFRRFQKDGAVLTDVHYRHSATMTCPGHAAISTGVSSDQNGIVANDWYDLEGRRKVYCVEDSTVELLGHPGVGRSPRLLMAPTIGDLLKDRSPESKVFAVGGKDRSAIMLAGHAADAAYWLQDSVITTSTYYIERAPDWVRAFNARHLPQQMHGMVWDRLLPKAYYDLLQGPDDFWNEEDKQALGKTFPHVITGGSAALDHNFYEALRKSPFEDEILLQFIEELVINEELGKDDVTDLLGIGLSTVDRIGHPYGPDSHEIMDDVVRTDRILSKLFAFLDDHVGMQDVLVVLTADHGIQRMPELVNDPEHGVWAARVSSSAVIQDVTRLLDEAFGPVGGGAHWVESLIYPHLYLSREALRRRGVSVEAATKVIADRLPEVTQYDAAVPAAGLKPVPAPEKYSIYPGRSGDVLIRLSNHHINRDSEFGTTHGTPWEGDQHVPMLWLGRNVRRGVYDDSTNVVDLAPTLAAMLGLEQSFDMGGRVKTEIVQGSN